MDRHNRIASALIIAEGLPKDASSLICHSSLNGIGDLRGARRDFNDDDDEVDNGELTKLDVVEQAEGALDDLCSDSLMAIDIVVEIWWIY